MGDGGVPLLTSARHLHSISRSCCSNERRFDAKRGLLAPSWISCDAPGGIWIRTALEATQ